MPYTLTTRSSVAFWELIEAYCKAIVVGCFNKCGSPVEPVFKGRYDERTPLCSGDVFLEQLPIFSMLRNLSSVAFWELIEAYCKAIVVGCFNKCGSPVEPVFKGRYDERTPLCSGDVFLEQLPIFSMLRNL